ncbi:bestrophin family protein [Massilia norwichensis]|uniref:Bestrophin family protein n=1 Tax=Massilia norwichensis TaxID=1442366 RepID=A0ABT2A1D6_9BURK|nr:bestrophin family protein [Massilia norwichensis]MCS0587999.1 bestrophin family protein [Massilia norwichensis]
MIVRDRPSPLRLFLIMRGSVLPNIWKSLLGTTLLAVLVTWSHGAIWGHKFTIGTIPFTLIGLPLAIFLGFRNNAAYDRYWEGRKQWGELVLRSRNLARQCLTLVDESPLRIRMIRRGIAVAHALRHRLRGSDPARDVMPWVEPDEWERLHQLPNLPYALMLAMGEDLSVLRHEGRIDPCIVPAIDGNLSAITGVAASCERIRSTPTPFSYTLLLHRTAYLYCWLLPFGLVDAIGDLTPAVTLLVAYTFFGLDALGDEIEEPFGTSDHDLPLEAMCRTIEIDLRMALGDTDLPPPLLPVDYRLN